jgi:crotonobetainyl-CoA:carnitine CoA-transferase CaiB-like acyl-CoA transferase
MMSLLDEWAANKSAAECEAILTEGNVPCSRYFTLRETLAQPHLAERGSFEVIDDGAGPLKVPNPAFKLQNHNVKARNYVPALGADNAAVLAEVLGYSNDRIEALYQRKILHGARI